MSRRMGWVPLALTLLMVLSASRSEALPAYSLTLNSTTVRSGNTPVGVDSAYAWSSHLQSVACAASLGAFPGLVRTVATMECSATSEYGVTGGLNATSSASTNDFVITGPPGATSVTGTFYFSVNGRVELNGGSPANNAHGGLLQFSMRAGSVLWMGQWFHGNYSYSGSYGLTGYAGPDVGTVIGLTGSFPVGAPFYVSMDANVANYVYGTLSSSPMLVRTVAAESPLGPTMSVGDLTGLVMALPAGYTAASPSWNVVDNHFLSPLLDAPPPPTPGARALALISPNPGGGLARLRFTLATPQRTELTIIDASGRRVRTLVADQLAAGPHELDWDGTDAQGRTTAPGVFFAQLQAGGQHSSVRLIRLR